MILAVDGATIAYDDTGSGTPVVFLHAFPLNRTMWAPQTSALAEHWRCIAPDMRGFGGSSATPPWTMDRLADDVVAVLDAREVQRAVVVGLSIGGYIAFALWRRHPSRVRALVLADTRATADDDAGRARRRELIDIARSKGSAAVAEVQVVGSLGKTTREKRPDLVESTRQLMASAPVEGIVGALEAMIVRPDSTGTLSSIDVPTLVLAGDEDPVTPPKVARATHEAIARSRLEVIAHAGHLSNLERPAAFNAVLAEFLAQLEST